MDRLLVAYRAARYFVGSGADALELRIDVANEELARLLAAHGVSHAAIITAHNPGSRRVSDRDNARAESALRRRVLAAGYASVPSRGVDPAGRFPDEPGLLVLGIEAAAATTLAREFAQAAIVVIEAMATPRLVMLG